MVKKRGAVCRFLYGGPENYLEIRRCNKPTLKRDSHYTDSVFPWNFSGSHTQNAYNASRFPLKSTAKIRQFCEVAKFIFHGGWGGTIKKRGWRAPLGYVWVGCYSEL